jgi:hypothetical protein
MNKCWYKLNFKIDGALKNPWPLIPTRNNGIWNPLSNSIYNQDWVSYMESIGLSVGSHSMVFYRGSKWNTDYAHLDVEDKKNSNNEIKFVSFGINWVLKGENSSMVWYNMPDGKNKIQYTPANTPYINFKIDTLNEIDRCNIQLEPVLVRVDMPHSISVGNKERWAISVRLKSYLSKMTWDETVEYMRSKNLLIER